MNNATILIVDDDQNNIFLLDLILKNEGFSTLSASNGDEAIETVRQNSIDLILMDVMMPRMDGFEASGHIHKMRESAHVPIIMLTAKKRDIHDVVRGLREGALEYMSKPFEEAELLAKVKSMLRIKKLHDENLKLLTELQEKRSQMEMELQIAKRVQETMLPSPKKLGFLGFNDKCIIEAYYHARESIGGDFYDFMDYGQNRLAVLIADVSGHGPAAAMITAMIKTLIVGESASRSSPSKFIKRLNGKLFNLLPADYFATIIFGVIDFNNNTITYTSGGHPSPFMFGQDRTDIEEFEKNGAMVGSFDDVEFDEDIIRFNKGDKLLMFSDGLFEVSNPEGGFYGISRLKKYLEAHKNASCRDVLDGIIAELDVFWDGKTERDDIAAVAIEFL